MSIKRALIMAGGTGGHVFPGLALASELKHRGFLVDWLGTEAGIEARLVPEQKVPLHFIPVRGVRGKNIKSLVSAPFNILCSVVAAVKIIANIKPNVVVGLGGFVAGPGGFAAKILRKPLVIHEQNAVAGTTNKILEKIANKVLTAYPNVFPNGRCIGNPVRKELEEMSDPQTRLAGRTGPLQILILGGSRGAQAINEIIPPALKKISEKYAIKIRHQAGAGKEESTINLYRNLNLEAQIEAFVDNIAEAYEWSDIVICRAGALTVSELAAAGVASILIPFPYAIDDHQTSNARYLEEAGAAILRQQSDLTEDNLAELFEELFKDRSKLLKMAFNARAKAKSNSVQIFADVCEGLVHE